MAIGVVGPAGTGTALCSVRSSAAYSSTRSVGATVRGLNVLPIAVTLYCSALPAQDSRQRRTTDRRDGCRPRLARGWPAPSSLS